MQIAGFAFDFQILTGQKAVIWSSGIIDFDNETVQYVRYIESEPALQWCLRFYLYEIQGWVELRSKTKASTCLTDEWNIDWEIKSNSE